LTSDDDKATLLFVEGGEAEGRLSGTAAVVEGPVVLVEGAAAVVEGETLLVVEVDICVFDPGSAVTLSLGLGGGGGSTILGDSSLEFPSSCRL